MSCLKACYAIYGDSVRDVPVQEFVAIRVAAGEVEKVDACENDKEAGEEGEGIDCVCGIEAAEEDE